MTRTELLRRLERLEDPLALLAIRLERGWHRAMLFLGVDAFDPEATRARTRRIGELTSKALPIVERRVEAAFKRMARSAAECGAALKSSAEAAES
jgi:hypothetical protein